MAHMCSSVRPARAPTCAVCCFLTHGASHKSEGIAEGFADRLPTRPPPLPPAASKRRWDMLVRSLRSLRESLISNHIFDDFAIQVRRHQCWADT